MSSVPPREPFSSRFGVRPSPQSRKPDEVPDSAKIRLVALIREERQKTLPGAYSLGPRLSEALGRIPKGSGDMSQIQSLIYGLDWWQFYDACEALIRISSAPEQLAARIESLFGSEGLPYRMTAAGIEWRLSEPAHTATTEASRILVQSPALQDAVGALEGTARILSGKLTRTFGDIIHTLSKTLGVHSSLSKAMSNVYGYRGAEQAVAHGATASLSDRILEANLVLHWCAAAIVYLERKAEVLGEARS